MRTGVSITHQNSTVKPKLLVIGGSGFLGSHLVMLSQKQGWEYRCPIEVNNLTHALLELARLPYTGILHVAGAERLSRYEFGVALAEYFHLSTTSLIPSKSAESSMIRPLDCSLDITRAKNLLETKLKGIRDI